VKDDDRGSILPLTIFFGFLSLVLILVVVAATSLYLERKRLFTVADGAALVGAEAFELDQVRAASDGSIDIGLESHDVAVAVDDYLDETPMNDFEGLRVAQAESVDGKSATVTLRAYWRPPVVSALVPDGFPIEVTAIARSMFE
jgi:uncharacterized membrane protein